MVEPHLVLWTMSTYCESELSTNTGGPVVEFYQRRGARSDRSAIPACAAYALRAARVFTFVDEAFAALGRIPDARIPQSRAQLDTGTAPPEPGSAVRATVVYSH